MNLILRACFKIINNYKILICNLEISPERVSLNKCEPDPETRSINHLGVMEWGGMRLVVQRDTPVIIQNHCGDDDEDDDRGIMKSEMGNVTSSMPLHIPILRNMIRSATEWRRTEIKRFFVSWNSFRQHLVWVGRGGQIRFHYLCLHIPQWYFETVA